MPAPSRPLAALVVLSVALIAAACGERAEPTGPAADLFPVTVVGGDDRPLTLGSPARRIVLLEPVFEETLMALGAGDRLAGVPVGEGGKLRTGELRKLAPDLVVASTATDERTLSHAAAATGVPIYIAQGASIREVERTISHLGVLTATPARARRLVRAIELQRDRVARRVAGRPEVSVFVDLGYFTTASNQTLTGDLLRAAGGRNIAARIVDGGPIDLADLRRADPEVYVTTTDSGTTLASLQKDRATRRLRAVRQKRVILVRPEALDPGPGIGDTLEQLARALHPNAYR